MVAFGPEMPGWGSWEWVGDDLCRELAESFRTVRFRGWDVPDCDVAVVVKHAPPLAAARQLARRARLVYCPVDYYGSAADLLADRAWLGLCARVVVHCERLREYFRPWAAVDYLASLGTGADRRAALAAGYEAIRAHETELAAQFLDGLGRLPSWRVWGIADRGRIGDRVPTFGLTHRTLPAAEVASLLGAQGLFVWSGHFYAQGLIERLGLAPAGMLRVGFLHYNTGGEVARTLDALAAVGD